MMFLTIPPEGSSRNGSRSPDSVAAWLLLK
jgi:hypothetical protein